jgi:hypothetical protein
MIPATRRLYYLPYDDETPVEIEVELPAWLDALAMQKGVDYSALLASALIKTLSIDNKNE